MNKKDDLDFVVFKFFFITMVQEFNCMYCFLEVGVKGLRWNGYWFFLSTLHVIKKTVASSNGAYGRSNLIKEGIAGPVEGVRLDCSIIIFKIL